LSTTTSTSSTTGALILSGGIGISNTTDATSSTNGGSFTTAGGMSIGKKLYVGDNIIMTNTLAPSQCILNFATDTQNWEFGARGSTAVYPNSLYIFNGSFLMSMTPAGVTSIYNTTASTTNGTGALLLNGGIGISNSTDAISSTNGGSFTTAGGMAIARSLRVGTSINCASISSTGVISTALLNIGTATDNSAGKMLNVLDSTLNIGTRFIILGKTPANNNQFEISFNHVGDNSTGNSASFGFFGQASRAITITAPGQISILNTTESTSSSTGALTISGGIGITKNLWIGNGLTLSAQNTVKVSTTAPTSFISLNDSPIYFRNTGTTDKNHFIAYAGNTPQTSWNSGKGFGNPNVANDGPVICGNTNVIIGTLNSLSTETICGNFTSTGLSLAGNGSTCPAPGYALDFVNNSQNMQINLLNGTYGIGACNSNLQSFTGGGFTWWNTASAIQKNGTAFSGPTSLMSLSSIGTLTIPASTASTTNGTGALLLSGGIGISNTTDATGSTNGGSFTTAGGMAIAKSLRVGTHIIIGHGSNQLSVYPLFVSAWATSTESTANAYRYNNTTGTTGIYNNTTYGNCSARFNDAIIASYFMAVSDKRIKTNIAEITIDFCKSFVMNCTPVSYNFKKDLNRGRNNTQFGYIAQELEQKGFANLVTHVDDTDNEYLIEEIETIDGKEYISPQGVKLSVSYEEIIPLLAQNIKTLYIENENQQTKIDILEQKNKDLEDRLAKIEQFISTLEISE